MDFPGERKAVEQVLSFGKKYGYGNLIVRLKCAWALQLMDSGLPLKAALGGALMTEEFSEVTPPEKVLAYLKAMTYTKDDKDD